MKYFIDFEATQFSKEIISVGCIREDGETFYSLCAPIKGKITPFITNLTGITAEAVSDAMSPDQVFNTFYTWAFSLDAENPEFYCWGDSDIEFLRNTFKRVESKRARFAIGYICGGLENYAKYVSQLVNVRKESLSLLKVNKIINPEATQNHNALDDAVMLKEIYDFINTHPHEQLREMFVESFGAKELAAAANAPKKWNELGLPVGSVCILNKQKVATSVFANIDEAAAWVIKSFMGNQKNDIGVENVKARILKSCYGKPYCGIKWGIVQEAKEV
jgi:DNA polymerase III epsilon subunit-like protein